MIPINVNENIPYKDEESGIVFYSMPIVGEVDYKVQEIISKVKDKEDVILTYQTTDELFDYLLKGWDVGNKNYPKFPNDGKPSKHFSQKDKSKMINIIMNLNNLSVDEKKS